MQPSNEDHPPPPIALILPGALLLGVHALALLLLTRGSGMGAGPDVYGIYNMVAAAGTACLIAWTMRRARDGRTPIRSVRALAWGIPLLDLVITLALAMTTGVRP